MVLSRSMSCSLSNTQKKFKLPLVGAFQMLADPLLTEHYAQLGFGAVLIDQQHGLLGTYNQRGLKVGPRLTDGASHLNF